MNDELVKTVLWICSSCNSIRDGEEELTPARLNHEPCDWCGVDLGTHCVYRSWMDENDERWGARAMSGEGLTRYVYERPTLTKATKLTHPNSSFWVPYDEADALVAKLRGDARRWERAFREKTARYSKVVRAAEEGTAKRDARIAELERENAELKEQVADWESQAFGRAEAGPAYDWDVEPVDSPVGRRELASVLEKMTSALSEVASRTRYSWAIDISDLNSMLARLEEGEDARGGEGDE